ncbi:MAG: polysaccharide biosynthesis protein [Clostridia bacterium]|nr:polysaccharide biosynthesis protein [Clostridia bacterium]
MKMNSRSKRRNADGFMSGVLVLSLSTVIVKVIGLAYKIPMISYLGAEGMGYFNSAYEIYAMLCVIATAGLPVALSLLISANRQNGAWGAIRRIDRCAMAVFLALGTLGMIFLLAFAHPIAKAIGNDDSFFCILAIAPALFFVCLSSAIRGYFQGFHQMLPTALSQLIEALGKLIFGVWFASLALKQGRSLPVVAAHAILGLSLGTLLSAVYLLGKKAIFRLTRGNDPSETLGNEKSDGMKTLLRIAFPITLSAAILSVTRLVDMALIMRRLQNIGYSVAEANEIYGAYTTLAVPVFSLLPSLIAPISMALVPQLSAAIARSSADDQATLADRSIRLTTLLAMPASMGIAVYASPILSILFSREREAIQIAAPLLSILGLSILFSGLITTTNAILQSYRQTVKPMISMSIGAIVKIIFAYFLIGNPSVGVYGAPISTLLCDMTVTCINLRFLGTAIPQSKCSRGVGQIYYKPMAASLLAILGSIAVYLPLLHTDFGGTIAFLTAILVAGFLYAIFAVCFKIVTSEDVAMLPMGEKILSRFRAHSMKNMNHQKKDEKNYDDQRKNSNVDDKNTI